ncbi:LysR family transcriptional regulator [Actinoplanes philippinensis]|uniref:DNA-binding transcriptional regulator, LysR family n=1 Tax=Actinoplanes philippinensis TaxID=35752 RepID=A0A1I2HBZ0_9ACTN|nr:LysR family transcriptional regulator [Actinoplanes philippinensis]GIE81680.1 LysR family transcriptional regulator [Actinoplanes philippinensis]SFF27694.1 DNA-binding transcriptional regulator, LysR family [Actinoplanes philippinensis]
MPGELSPSGLRVLREVAQRGSFTAAARALGYTQSAVSRQVMVLEKAAGRALFERRRDGVTLTVAGARLLPRAIRILDELDAAAGELTGDPVASGAVRLGAFPTATAALIPGVLRALPGDVVVSVREGSTPTLVRSLRAGTLDLAVLAHVPPFRPLDAETPALPLVTLAERELLVCIGAGHPFAARDAVEADELVGQVWVAGRSDTGEALPGVWPGLPGRPDVRYVVRDWWSKLRLVAAGLAVTTMPAVAVDLLPDDVRTVAVRGAAREMRRLVLAHRPGPLSDAARYVADVLRRQTRL